MDTNLKDLYDDKLEDILENISLKTPRNPYSHFVIEQSKKNKNKEKNFVFGDFIKKCAIAWRNLNENEKTKYIKLFENEKKEYKKAIQIVRHYLFKDYNGIVRKAPTAYKIFVNEKIVEGFEKNFDPKEVKLEARKEWKNMDKKQKHIYIVKKKINDNWFERAKNLKKVKPISLFIEKILQDEKYRNNLPKLKDVVKMWKELKKNEKIKYKKYVEEIIKERERLRDIYELINGIKPKKPAGAFRLFFKEKIKEKTFTNFYEAAELWKKLSEDEKQEYFKKSHACTLAYRYKKMIYEKKIRKMLPKKPLPAFGIYIKEKKGQKIQNGGNAILYWKNEFDNLTNEQKKKYEIIAEQEKIKYKKKMEYYENAIFDIPKKPIKAFALYFKKNYNRFIENKKNLNINDFYKIMSLNWNKEDESLRNEYKKIAESDHKRFHIELKQFKKLGYYFKIDLKDIDNENLDFDNSDSERKKTIKKKRTVRNDYKKRGIKKTKSLDKINRKRIKSKSPNKKITRIGKTQMKKTN